jgi:hypothetical protein
MMALMAFFAAGISASSIRTATHVWDVVAEKMLMFAFWRQDVMSARNPDLYPAPESYTLSVATFGR